MDTNEIAVIFDKIEDPRIERHRLYPIGEIFFLVLCAILIGIKSWRGIETYGDQRLEWLRQFKPFVHGIPSHQTIGRVFSIIKPKVFETIFIQFMIAATGKESGKIIALDGKTLKGSFDTDSGKQALHVLNACAVDNGLLLGQMKVDSKTNEIRIVPELLDLLDVKGATITTDALNTQKDIAEKIVKLSNDYVLPVKDNHKNLRKEIEEKFQNMPPNKEDRKTFTETVEKGHGRIDHREYQVLAEEVLSLQTIKEWKTIKSIGIARTTSFRRNKKSTEIRYYIMSFKQDTERFAKAVRGHWGIENKIHWTLDVTFGEDQCRVRKDWAPQNFSLMRKLAMNVLTRIFHPHQLFEQIKSTMFYFYKN
jgi:predicted transposase YbfD/YdcC